MRIVGKVCGWAAAAMLVLQAISMFYGYPIQGIAGGIELIALAVSCATDAIFNFERPKRPYLEWRATYKDGIEKKFTMPAKAQFSIPATPENPVIKLGVTYFESDKDEVKDEQLY